MRFTLTTLLLLLACGFSQITAAQEFSVAEAETETEPQKHLDLFAGKTVEDWGWEVTNFGGEGEVKIVDDQIVMSPGFPMTGIHRDREEDLPTSNYEITLEAKRIEGIDFFCALTFPVQDSHCTFVVAGWAGGTVGLSCVDGNDASSNDTTKIMAFEDNRWYPIKVRVTDEQITCWLDGEKAVEQPLKGHTISVRGDIGASRPIGLAAFESKVAYRKIRMTPIDAKPNKSDE
jgi:hypothetical protein